MAETWQQVVMEKDPATMTPADVANLGPAPRELTPPLDKYVKLAKPSFAWLWIVISIFSVGGFAIMVAAVGASTSMLTNLWFPLLTIGLAIWTGRGASRRRAALRTVLREGSLRFARLVENRQETVGKGMAKRYRYHAAFDVDGRRVPFVIMNDGMSMLQPGQLVEVVYHPELPDEIVPAFLLV